ncbi:MAG: PBP1A family penicillin-binding protein [Actinomycetota bacterium]|nr:PBP1A family penicillin-binding protein [Actinomycetota bacterium]
MLVLYNISPMHTGTLVRGSRRRRRLRKQTKVWGRVRNAFLLLVALGAVCVVGVVSSFSYSYYAFADELPELDNYESAELAQTSTVYDSEENVVQELSGVQNRFVVDVEDINPTLTDAVVAIEDHRFYDHQGLDFEAIARAAQANIETLSVQEGGSTITQQLIKNTYIAQEQRAVPSFQRKINEAALSWQYEKEFSKPDILEQYLNTVYFGANAYGAEAAARTYFNKSAEELSLPESAMLAGIINLPGAYDPFADPESAVARRNVVLDRMLEYGHIDQATHDEAVAADLELSRGRVEPQNDNEYFLDAVRSELAREYGDEMVYEGGLNIYTTLDPDLQGLANEAVNSVVAPENGDPSASLVSVDPGTGAVRAMVGGSNFEEVEFNLATQSERQPGSSFKPFVLAEMIEQGYSPDSMYTSEDLRIPLPEGSDEPFYEVSNYADIERGRISVDEATAESDNTVYVQLAMDLGLENVVEMANSLGIESPLEAFPSTALGGLGQGVNPLEMASAYSTFANSGTHMDSFLVERVTTNDENGEEVLVEEHELAGEEVLTQDEAAVATETLRGVVERGTASAYHDLDSEIDRPSAGKTGTTEEFADAWYVGYIPQLATSVWVGYPGERRSMVNINGLSEINGENYPLDIWSNYMQDAASSFDEQEFDAPSPSLNLRTLNAAEDTSETTREDTSSFFDDDEDDDPFEQTIPQFTPDVFEAPAPQIPRRPASSQQPVAPQQPATPQPQPATPQPAPQQPSGGGSGPGGGFGDGFPFD